jgi:hypothetical protein
MTAFLGSKRNPLKRKTPLKPNQRRKAERFQLAFGDKGEWVRQMNCVVCGRLPSVAAHVKSRGAGGTAKDLVPLCPNHHFEQHAVGIRTFDRLHDIDLTTLAAEYEERWLAHEGGDDDLGF